MNISPENRIAVFPFVCCLAVCFVVSCLATALATVEAWRNRWPLWRWANREVGPLAFELGHRAIGVVL